MHLAKPVNDESRRKLIVDTYQSTISTLDCDPELKAALRSNERIPLFLSNLEKQFLSVPAPMQTRDNVIYTVRELTKVFTANIQKKAEEMMLSDAEKTRLQHNADNAAVIDKACDTGIIDEEVMSVLAEES